MPPNSDLPLSADDLLAEAWGVIANAGLQRGGWDHEHPEWVEAAEKWRDKWHAHLGLTDDRPKGNAGRCRVSRLGDLIIEHGPYDGVTPPLSVRSYAMQADELNDLRDELIELRRVTALIPDDGRVRVYAVANLHKGRIHGITCNVNQSAAWVRALCDQYGPDAAVQCMDLVDPEQQTIAWDRGERATVSAPNPPDNTDRDICARFKDGRRCGLPVEFVPEGTGVISGWWHTDRSVSSDHHAVPERLVR